MPPLVIAIDGPAAAGKGTLARRIAAALGLPYLESGLLYRAVGRRVLDAGLDPTDRVAAVAAARALEPADLERPDLRGPEADAASSAVAAVPDVRAALLAFQRGFVRSAGAVIDGRDIGTVVLPNATVKLFVTADPAERARRRYLELQAKGTNVTPAQVSADMAARDRRDAGRDIAPMTPAKDAVLVDTTGQDPDSVFETAMAAIRHKLPRGEPR